MDIIERTLNDMQAYLDSCKTQAFSSRKVIVERDVMEEYITDIRTQAPDELSRCSKIINNKESIIADARKQADQILSDANQRTNRLINEHEITQQAAEQAQLMLDNAQKKAQEIINQAVEEANSIQESAIRYTDDILKGLQDMFVQNIGTIQTQFNEFMTSAQESYETITNNREELAIDLADTTPLSQYNEDEESATLEENEEYDTNEDFNDEYEK